MPFATLSSQPPPTSGHTPMPHNLSDMLFLPPIPPDVADRQRRYYPVAANAHPTDIFAVRRNLCTVSGFRFINKTNHKQMLMFIDGACINNGRPDARGGCGVRLTSLDCGPGINHALEANGATPQTSNRAELRAAILALGLRYWPGEGFNNVILACDSEYVVLNLCEHLNKWIRNGWTTARGTPVQHRDLWEALLAKLRELEGCGLLVQFWLIPRQWNEADSLAKEAAVSTAQPPAFQT